MKNTLSCEGKIRSFDGTELFFKKDMPDNPKAVFVFVHGLCEHLGRYDYIAEKFNEFGYGVYRFDNRGHGRSGGERGYIEDFKYFIDDADMVVDTVKRENPELPIFMLGHSMGGYITAAYGVKYPNRLNGQIFSGACTIELPIFEGLKKIDFDENPREKSPNSLSSMICRDPEVIKCYEDDPLVLKETNIKLLGEVFIKGVAWLNEHIDEYTYPCIILHGGDDRIVTCESSKYLYENIHSKDKELKIYSDLFHEILNEKEKDKIIDDIHNWVEKRL